MANNNPHTLIKDINKVKPGTYIEIDLEQSNVEEHSYLERELWFTQNTDNSLSKLEEILEDSVKTRLESDVGASVLLSGGVDSTLLAYYAKKHLGDDLSAYSIVFERGSSFCEEDRIDFVSKKLNLKTQKIIFCYEDIVRNIEDIVEALEEPICDPGIFSNYTIFKFMQGREKVALSGLGGDELFAGYLRHRAFHLRNKLPDSFVKLLRKFITKPEYNESSIGRFNTRIYRFLSSNDNFYKSYLSKNVYYDNKFSLDFEFKTIHDVLRYELLYPISDQLLNITDKFSMHFSIEGRCPLISNAMLEHATTQNIAKEVNSFTGKKSLKAIASKHFGRNFVNQKKSGFSSPLDGIIDRVPMNDFIEADSMLAKYIGQMPEQENNSFFRFQKLILGKWLKRNMELS